MSTGLSLARRGAALICGVTTLAQAAGADATALTQAVGASRDSARVLEMASAAAALDEDKQCKAAAEATAALRADSSTEATRLFTLASTAGASHQACEAARAKTKMAMANLAAVDGILRDAALKLAACLSGTAAHCNADATLGSLDQAQRKAGMPGVLAMAPAYAMPGDDAVQALLKEAAGAQDTVDGLRKKGAGVYDIGDGATAAALTLPFAELSTGKQRRNVQTAAQNWSELALKAPREMRREIRLAQEAADAFVAEASKLNQCTLLDNPKDPALRTTCTKSHFAAASAAQATLKQHQTEAEKLHQSLAEAGYGLAVLKEKSDIVEPVLSQQIAFRRIVDSNPDVKSYFGGDAVGLTAGTADSTATLRYTMTDKAWGNYNRLSLIASTPTNDKGITRFVDDADKLKDKTSLELVYQRTNAGWKLPALEWINDFAFGLKATREQHAYLQPKLTTTPLDLGETKRYFNGASAGLKWVFFTGPESNKGLLQFSADYQRYYKDSKDVGIRCPPGNVADAKLVECTSGALGEPTKAYNRLLGLSYKQHFANFDIALRIKHSQGDKTTDFELPIFFIRSLPDDKNNTPFSGGLSLNWNSGTPGLKFGLFVSTPLSFSHPPRP